MRSNWFYAALVGVCRRVPTLKAIEEALGGVAGIARVIRPAEYGQLGFPMVVKGGRMSDLVLAAQPGYAFENPTTGETVVDVPEGASRGSHGYLNSDPDMYAILVAWGAGIQPGARLGLVPNVDVAPTIAHLLGLNLPSSDGKPLQEIFRK